MTNGDGGRAGSCAVRVFTGKSTAASCARGPVVVGEARSHQDDDGDDDNNNNLVHSSFLQNVSLGASTELARVRGAFAGAVPVGSGGGRMGQRPGPQSELQCGTVCYSATDRKSTRLNSSHPV